jgi:hypothetical protein
MPTCPLCGVTVSQLKSGSHIVPEWMYLDSYDEKHRTNHIDVAKKVVTLIQKGLRDRFICSTCEDMFAGDDDFGKKCLIAKKGVTTKVVFAKGGFKVEHWTDFDFKRLQKFILSVVIRWYLSANGNEKNTLGSNNYGKIKALYYGKTKDDSTLPIVIYKPVADKEFIPVTFPFVGDNQGVKVCSFYGVGLGFQILVEGTSNTPVNFREFKIKKTNSMYMFQIPFYQTQMASKIANLLSGIKSPNR